MKKAILVIILASLILLIVLGLRCARETERRDQALVTGLSSYPREQKQSVANLISRIVYFRDSKTDICFAYYWGRDMNGTTAVGGPALATVPCEKVEKVPGLLIDPSTH